MPTIAANTDDGYQSSGLDASWDTVHDATGFLTPTTTRSSYGWSAEAVYYGAPRSSMNIRRYFASSQVDLQNINEKNTFPIINLLKYQ